MRFPYTHAASWKKKNDRHVQPILGNHLRSLSPSLLLTGVCQAACPVCLLLLLVISFVGKAYYVCCSLNYGKVVCAQFKQAPVLLFINIAHASCLSNALLCSHTTFVHSCRLCQQGFDRATKEFFAQTNSTERIDRGAARLQPDGAGNGIFQDAQGILQLPWEVLPVLPSSLGFQL